MEAEDITEDMIHEYRRNGVIKIPGVITKQEAARFREATIEILNGMPTPEPPAKYNRAFHQKVNVWQDHPVMRELTLHPNVAAVAEKIASTRLRLWHDHILAKMPGLKVPTAFHQDLVKWPYDRSTNALSAWIALQDTTVEMGCMSFVPGSHKITDVKDIATSDQEGWKREIPRLEWWPTLTIPLRAGDCTFHHGMTFHRAGTNQTDQWRAAHVIIFIDSQATYTGKRHRVSDPLNLEIGSPPPDDVFPRLAPLYSTASSGVTMK